MAKILVVDDELFYRELSADVLRKDGHEVAQARDGREAVAAFSGNCFDLVLLDVVMPGSFDGLAALSKLNREDPDVPVIMLSAHEDKQMVLKALRFGAFDYLRKPLSPPELKAAADRALEHRRLTVAAKEKLRRLSSLEESAKRLAGWVGQTFRLEDLAREYEMLQATVQQVAEVLECERVSVMLLDPAQNKLKMAVNLGMGPAQAAAEKPPSGPSFSTRVFETGEAVLVADVNRDERFSAGEHAGQYRTPSFVIAPLRVADRIIGTINANDKKTGGPFTEDDLVLLKTFSHQISLSFVHALAVADLEREKTRLKRQNDLQRILIKYLEPEEMLRQMLLKCQELMGVVSSAVFLLDELTGGLWLRMGLNGSKPITALHRIALGASITGLAAQENKIYIVNRPVEEPRFDQQIEWPDSGEIRNLVAVPLRFSDETVGVLRLLNRREGGFTKDDAQFLKDLAASLAVAIRNLKLYEQLKRSLDETASTNRMLQQSNDELTQKAKELEALKKSPGSGKSK